MAATIPSLDTGHGDVVHTGPVVSGVPATPSRPTVLVSLSTFAFKGLEPTWQRVLDAVAPLDARVIATTGPAVDAGRLRVPANVELHPWLPHAEVMPEVSMVVEPRWPRDDHGGAGPRPAAAGHPDGRHDRPAVHRQGDRACGRRSDDGAQVLTGEDPRGRGGAARRRARTARRPPVSARRCAACRGRSSAPTSVEDAAQGRSCGARSPARLDRDVGESEPGGQLAELRRELVGGVLGGAVLGPRRLHDQPAVLAVGLEVDPADDLVAEQERQHVVAVHPLVRGRVDLDAVVEVEQLLAALAQPHDRVEGAQEGSRLHLARPARVAVEVRRTVPPLDRAPAAARPPRRARRQPASPRRSSSGSSRPGSAASPRRARPPRGGPARDRRPRATASAAPGPRPGSPAPARRRSPRTGCCAPPRPARRPCRGSRGPSWPPTSSSPSASCRAARRRRGRGRCSARGRRPRRAAARRGRRRPPATTCPAGRGRTPCGAASPATARPASAPGRAPSTRPAAGASSPPPESAVRCRRAPSARTAACSAPAAGRSPSRPGARRCAPACGRRSASSAWCAAGRGTPARRARSGAPDACEQPRAMLR